MSIHVYWDNPEKTILRRDLVGKWTWEEYAQAGQQTRIMLTSVAHPVHLLCDIRFSVPQTGELAGTHFRKELSAIPVNVAGSCLVGRGSSTLYLYKLIAANCKQLKNRMAHVESIEDAYRQITLFRMLQKQI